MRSNQKRTENLAYDAQGGMALDFAPSAITLDKGVMAATCVFSTGARDRVGDIMEVAGIHTENHQRNPVVFWNHAKILTLPIGKTRDPDGNYTVVIDGEYARQTTYFSQSLPEAEQIYRLIEEGIISANSIRFDTIRAQPIYTGNRKGLHIIESDLVEVSWVGVGINQEAVTKALAGLVCGRPLVASIRRDLEPYALRAGAWSNGATIMKAFDCRGAILEAAELPSLHDIEAVAEYLADNYPADEIENRIEDWNDLMANQGNTDRLIVVAGELGDPIIEIADGPEEAKGLRFWLRKDAISAQPD